MIFRKLTVLFCTIIWICTFSMNAFAIVESGLVGHWKFDYNGDDASGHGHHGTLKGSPLFSWYGVVNSCLQLDGVNDAVIIPNSGGELMHSNAITIEAWIKQPVYQSGYQDIYTNFSDFRFSVVDGYLAVNSSGNWWSPHSFRIGKNQWTHVCYVYTGERRILYLNGLLKASESIQRYLSNSGQVGISSEAHPLNGSIDEMKVYNRALSDVEVYQNYYTDKYGSWDPSIVNIFVIFPNANTPVIHTGDDFAIQWNVTPLAGDAVKIEVLEGETVRQTISGNSPNDGYFTWHISYMLPTGNNYHIRISSLSNTSVLATSPAFAIQASGTIPLKKEGRIYQVPESKVPEIDGELDDVVWQFAEPESLLYGVQYSASWTRWQDNLVTWKGVWCEETNKIYLGIHVIDDIRGVFDNGPGSSDYSPEQDECIELYIDGDMSGGEYWEQFGPAQAFRVAEEGYQDLLHYPSVAAYPAVYDGDGFYSAVSQGADGNWDCEIEMLVYNHFPNDIRILSEGAQMGLDLWYNDSDNAIYNNTYRLELQTGWFFDGPVWKQADDMGILSLGGNLEIPEIVVHLPEGWDSGYIQGDEFMITWEASPGVGNVQVDLYNGQEFYTTLYTSVSSENAYIWQIPSDQEPGSDYFIQVSSIVHPVVRDMTEQPIQIQYRPTLVCTFPPDTGSTTWHTETPMNISWESRGEVGDYVSIALVKDSVEIYQVTSNTENDSTFVWNIPADSTVLGNGLSVKIASVTQPEVNVTSDPVINILPTQHLNLRYPNERGIVFHTDSTYQILWHEAFVNLIRIELFHQDTLFSILADSADAKTPFQWDIPEDMLLGPGFKIRLTSLTDSLIVDVGSFDFNIIRVLKITTHIDHLKPDVLTGETLTIQWETIGPVGPYFDIKLYHGQVCYSTLGENVEGNEYNWTIPSDFPNLTDCRVKVISCSDTTIYDYSDDSFDIQNTSAVQMILPLKTELKGNYPNPFNPKTQIDYDVSEPALVQIEVFDLMGRKVRTLVHSKKQPGSYQAIWDGRDDAGQTVSSGTYIYMMRCGDYRKMMKAVFLK